MNNSDDFDLEEFKSFRKSNADSDSDDDDDAPMPPRTAAPDDHDNDRDVVFSKPSLLIHEESAFSKRLRKRAPLGLEWHDLSLWLPLGKKKGIKRILRSVTAECPGGELLSVMGPSGAGKTTLLNVLAMRVPSGTVRGTVRIDGKRFTARQFRRISSYVEQDDRLFPWLTVRETLRYVARLRLPSSVARADKDRLVEDIISELGLVKCADTIVGNAIVRGISGGERKRLAIGCELVVDPSILFLDEPTSGLDANAALHVVETLRALARAGRTVICTIHQPRSGIYSMFDNLLLLAGEGETAYFGRAADAVPYFARLGFECPAFTNPADFFLDITAINSQSKELIAESKARIASLTVAFAESRAPPRAAPSDDAPQIEVTLAQGSSFFTQLDVLTRRTARNVYRDKARTIVRFVTALIVGALFGFIFYQRGYTLEDIQNRTGILFLICTNQAFGGLFAVLTTFLEEREIFLKERSLAYYRVVPYFLAKSIAEFPLSLSPLLFGVVLYWIVGLNPDLDRFGIFLALVFLASFVSESLGLFIAAIAKSAALANAISPLFLVFFLILSGLYLNTDTIPDWIIWLKYISFIKYAYHGMMLNEFLGTEFSGTQLLPNGTSVVVVQTGEQVIDQLAMSEEQEGTVLDDILILIGMSLIYRLGAYLVLRFLRRGPRMGEVQKASANEIAMLAEQK